MPGADLNCERTCHMHPDSNEPHICPSRRSPPIAMGRAAGSCQSCQCIPNSKLVNVHFKKLWNGHILSFKIVHSPILHLGRINKTNRNSNASHRNRQTPPGQENAQLAAPKMHATHTPAIQICLSQHLCALSVGTQQQATNPRNCTAKYGAAAHVSLLYVGSEMTSIENHALDG